MKLRENEKSYHDKTWEVMNELDVFPSKLIILKHLLESVQTSIIKKDVKLAEYLLDAAQDLVEHYTGDFEKKFQTAWHQVLQISNVADEKTKNNPTSILTCDSNDPSPECQTQWTDFWESDNESDDVKHSSHWYEYDRNDPNRKNPFLVKKDDGSWSVPVEITPDGEYLITFPDDLVDKVGWAEGDTLEWIDNNDGSFSLKKFVE